MPATASLRSRRSNKINVERRRSMATQKRVFAFPKERKEPLTDARHVRNAIARFDQVEDVTDAERDSAWKRILNAAKKFDVEVEADDWRDLFVGGKARKRRPLEPKRAPARRASD